MITKADAAWLERALELGQRAGRATAPNPRVGAVVVRADSVVGQGAHSRCGAPHAEALALAAAGRDAVGATLYVSLEPCAHEGKTPPCASAVIAAGIARVVIGVLDPDSRVAGRGVEQLRAAGIDVETAEGTVARSAARGLEDYLVHRQQQRSFATLKMAATLDGRIADRWGHARWITGSAARAHGRSYRDRCSAIIVGAGTVIADDPQLLPLTPPEQSGPFLRCVVDRSLRTPPSAQLFRNLESQVVVFTSEYSSERNRRALAERGAEVVVLSEAEQGCAPRAILERLARRGVLAALIEGGARTHGAFLAAGVADKLLWYVAPRVLGDPEAVAAVELGERPLQAALDFRVESIEQLEADLCLTLYPNAR